jgi:hypothetical protein
MYKLGIYIEVWSYIQDTFTTSIPLVILVIGGTVEEFEVVTSTLFFKFLI